MSEKKGNRLYQAARNSHNPNGEGHNRTYMPFNRPIPDRKSTRDRSSGLDTLVQAEKMMQIAILLPSAAFIGWLFGSWLDKALHQKWLAIAGIAFGGISGLVYVVRLVLASGDQGKTEKGKRNGES